MRAIDSNVFIYALDGQADLSQRARALLSECELAGEFVASQLVVMEVLRKPLEASPELAGLAQQFLTSFQRLWWVSVDADVAARAAGLLASNGKKLKPLDALHLASALSAGADEFWTNDAELIAVAVPGLTIRRLAV